MENKIIIDNVEYDVNSLNDETKAQIISLQFCESELARLQAQVAAIQTARNAYANALKSLLTPAMGETIKFN